MIYKNCELEDKLEEYKERCKLREQRIALLEEKEAKYNDVMTIRRNQLHDANVKLELKEHDNMSLKLQESIKVNNHCCNQMCKSNNQEEKDWTRGRSSLYALLIALKVTQIRVPLSLLLSQAVVTQYNLGYRAACALLRVWLPSQLCEKLQPPLGYHKGLSADLECNWGNASDRMEELKRVMGGRDARRTNALENAILNRGDNPIIFCSEYLILYCSTYNCRDMSPDDNSFLYSMANKCTFVDYPTKVVLRNANSYQAFVYILDRGLDSEHKS
ncbi:unnamed protein product [Ranitomeya imitator]|uniref:Uncharacterized protein n=1 Tax=Ranitomeya imitator TaxID=111125 RepID=A0ABN9MIS8_9NEOB|nr:unnamed protein product [Ranitomeya imitator]